MNIIHPHYSLLAARIVVDNLHKETSDSFLETIEILRNCTNKIGIIKLISLNINNILKINKNIGTLAPLISDEVYEVVKNNAEKI